MRLFQARQKLPPLCEILCVKSHDLETEVGHYLSDEARLKLVAILKNKLQG